MILRVVGLLCAVAVSACMVGPDFKQPDAPKAEQYTAAELSLDQVDSVAGQKIVDGSEVPLEWWKMFGSEALDALIERGLENSLTVAAARARLREVQENLNAQVGAVLYPSVDAKGSVSRQKISGTSFGGNVRKYQYVDGRCSKCLSIRF